MKKWIILIFIVLFFFSPLVSATPPAPYSVLSVDGTWVPVRLDVNGNPTGPLFSKDQQRFTSLDKTYGKTVFEQKGDDNYVEMYEKQTQCPVISQRNNTTGKAFLYFAKLRTDGYFYPDMSLPFKPHLYAGDIQNQGIVCGYESIRRIRPLRPPSPILHGDLNSYQLRQYTNAQTGIGVKQQPSGSYTYYNPDLQQQQQQGKLPPPPLTRPKPIILFTGQAVYDNSQYHQQHELGVIVIPVQFPDISAHASLNEVKQQMFGTTDSLASYYTQQSSGALTLTGDIAPSWYTLSENMGYYGDNYEAHVDQMITEAIRAADPQVDFSKYDRDGDGVVDELLVVHAGEPDENGGGNGPEIWSHYYSISPITVDGVQIIDYETVSEDSPTGIIAHEFGHSLGLPDLYDTVSDDGNSKGTAEWSIMGYGGYLNPPASFDPWSKKYLAFTTDTTYQQITSNGYYTVIQDTSSIGGVKYYAIPVSSTEEFLLENRHKENLLSGDSSGGVLIWHIDESVINETGNWNGCSGTRWSCNTVNGDASHKLIDLEEDGTQVLDQDKLAAPTDPWYDSCGPFGSCQPHEFSSRSDPAAVSYDGSKQIYVGVYSDIGTTMELGVTLDGSTLAAPSSNSASTTNVGVSAPASHGLGIITFLVLGISLLLILGASFIAWRLLRKKDVLVI